MLMSVIIAITLLVSPLQSPQRNLEGIFGERMASAHAFRSGLVQTFSANARGDERLENLVQLLRDQSIPAFLYDGGMVYEKRLLRDENTAANQFLVIAVRPGWKDDSDVPTWVAGALRTAPIIYCHEYHALLWSDVSFTDEWTSIVLAYHLTVIETALRRGDAEETEREFWETEVRSYENEFRVLQKLTRGEFSKALKKRKGKRGVRGLTLSRESS